MKVQGTSGDSNARWSPPYLPHPAGVIGSNGLGEWIASVYRDMSKRRSGHVFLYNISLETFNWPSFSNVWLTNYGVGSRIDTVTILLPVESYGTDTIKVCPWLDWDALRGFTEQCFKHPEDIEDALSLCSRAQVGLVDVSKTELKKLAGEYAFGVYLSLPKTVDVFEMLSKAHVVTAENNGERISREAQTARNLLKRNVELVLGAGIDEPFSSRSTDEGPYSYRLIVPIYSCHHQKREDPSRYCVIEEHIKVLAELWHHSKSPLRLEGKRCDELEDSLPLIDDQQRAARLDTAIAWSASGLTQTGRIRDEFRLRRVDRQFRRLMPDYRPQAEDCAVDIASHISELARVRISNCTLFPNQPFYVSAKTKEDLTGSFVKKALERVENMVHGEKMRKATYPAFLLCGGSGSGKTEMAQSLGKYLVRRKALAKKRLCYINCGLHKNFSDLEARVFEARDECITTKKLTYLLLDEIQTVKSFQEFKELCYPLADLYDKEEVPLLVGLLTSFPPDKIRRRVYTDTVAAGDFWRRIENFQATAPAYSISDLITVCACVLGQTFGGNCRATKESLAFLLLRNRRLPSSSDICDFIGGFAAKARPMRGKSVPVNASFFVDGKAGEADLKKFRAQYSGLIGSDLKGVTIIEP